MTAKLERERAIVLQGPQGCGKSQLAQKIAAAHGSFVTTTGVTLQSPFCLSKLLAGRFDTVIVEETPAKLLNTDLVKSLVSGEPQVIQLKGGEPEEVPTPNFIFCTGDLDAIPLSPDDRRFLVLSTSGVY